MSHQGIVIAAVVDTAKATEYAHGSIPTQTADCTAMADGEGLAASATQSDAAKSAYHGSRSDVLVQARQHAERRCR